MEHRVKVVPPALIMEPLLGLLDEAEAVPLVITGGSMTPFLVHRRDTVYLSKPKSPLKKGDMVLYQRTSGAYVLHRVLKVENGLYTMVGDAQTYLEPGIREDQIRAVVTAKNATGNTLLVNSNCQISAISHSKTVGGKQVILVSCPTGPSEAGSNLSGATYRLNGKIFAFTVEDDGTMTNVGFVNVTSNDNQFMYSCLTELSDGTVGILYEDHQSEWGSADWNDNGQEAYYTMSFAKYNLTIAMGLTFDSKPTEPEVTEPEATKPSKSGKPAEDAKQPGAVAKLNIVFVNMLGKKVATATVTASGTANEYCVFTPFEILAQAPAGRLIMRFVPAVVSYGDTATIIVPVI